jgi:uncharacterized protein DUF3568
MQTFSLIVVLAASVALSGCVALPVLAPAAASAGGDLVKAGTVRTFGGATQRTFSVPLSVLYAATRQTLDQLGFAPPEEKSVDERVTLYAYAIDRAVRIDLMPVTGEMTQMRVFVRKDNFGKDVATASELVTQTEQTLNPPPAERAAQHRLRERRATAR